MTTRKSDPICFKHDEIMQLCKELKSLDLFKVSGRKKVIPLVNKIIKLAEQAKEDGQNMENRLVEYYDAIYDLGFDRKKK